MGTGSNPNSFNDVFLRETLLPNISISLRFIANIPVSLCRHFHTYRNSPETLKMLEKYRILVVYNVTLRK